ncbi:unnamed protein product, partial [Trichobilharzia regenti]
EHLDLLLSCLTDSDLEFIIGWFVSWLEKLCVLKNKDLLILFREALRALSSSCDCDECLILFQGYLDTSSNVKHFIQLLELTSACAQRVGVKRFRRIKGIFERCEMFAQNLSGVELFSILSSSENALRNMISRNSIEQLSHPDKLFLRRHILYLISMLSYIHSGDKEGLLMSFIDHLSVVCEGLYTFYLSCKLLVELPDLTVCQKTVASVYVPGWLQLLHRFTMGKDENMYKFWPLVFTYEHNIDLACPFILYLLDKSKQHFFLGSCKCNQLDAVHHTFNENRYLEMRSFAVLFLEKLFKRHYCSLQRDWWNSRRLRLLEYLQIIAVEPVSTEVLPSFTTQIIGCIEQLVLSSTYLARLLIYFQLLQPNSKTMHYGWRGHVITMFKNHLHEVIMGSIDDSKARKTPSIPENIAEVCHSEEVAHIFHLIFRYPTPSNPQEDITDESSWLLAALNLSLYIFLRFKSYPSSLTYKLFDILNHASETQDSYFNKFMCNLKSRLEKRIIQCQTHIFTLKATLSNSGDGVERGRLTSELGVQESIMLRLRLVEMTLNQTHTAFLECKLVQKA